LLVLIDSVCVETALDSMQSGVVLGQARFQMRVVFIPTFGQIFSELGFATLLSRIHELLFGNLSLL